MESLLRWSIEHSGGNNGQQPAEPRKDLDPAIIDHILGKSDAVQMKEALDIALDENRDDDERIQALDDFEMVRFNSRRSYHTAEYVLPDSWWNTLITPTVRMPEA